MLSRAPGPVAPPRLNLRASGCRPCAQPRRPHPHRLRAREPREPRLVRARAESEQLGEAFAVAERQAATDEEAMDVSSESWTSDADWAKAHGYSVDGMVREPRRCERARDNCGASLQPTVSPRCALLPVRRRLTRAGWRRALRTWRVWTQGCRATRNTCSTGGRSSSSAGELSRRVDRLLPVSATRKLTPPTTRGVAGLRGRAGDVLDGARCSEEPTRSTP